MTSIHYSKAPIIEALIDVQTNRVSDNRLALLRSIKFPTGYKEAHILAEFLGEFKVGGDRSPVASTKTGQLGYRFESADGKYAVQVRLNGFTFSRLAPYESWEPFISEAQNIWRLFREAIGDASITQFSVRYVNKLHLPPGIDMKVYLRTYPEVSPDLPQMLHGSFMRLEIPLAQPEGTLILHQFYAPPDIPDQVGMILDNEFRLQAGPELTDMELWERINDLREVKNSVFRGCLTKKMEEMIA